MSAGYLRWLCLLSAMAAFVTQSEGASATVWTAYWEVRLFLAESRSVPANVGGLIVDLRDGAGGPTVPDDVGQLTEAQKAELASEIVGYGELKLVDADGQLQAFDLRFHGDLLWLSFEIEPGDYALVSRSIPSDTSTSGHVETPFTVTPAVPVPSSIGTLEISTSCDDAGGCDTKRDLINHARIAYSEEALPFASVMLHRWWPSWPAGIWSATPPGTEITGQETWGNWWPARIHSSWSHSCSPNTRYVPQLEEGEHRVAAGTTLAGFWEQLPDLDATLHVSCEDCSFRELPPECGTSGSLSSSGGSPSSNPGDSERAPKETTQTSGCSLRGAGMRASPRFEWITLALGWLLIGRRYGSRFGRLVRSAWDAAPRRDHRCR